MEITIVRQDLGKRIVLKPELIFKTSRYEIYTRRGVKVLYPTAIEKVLSKELTNEGIVF
jgi:hypothetical protein